MNALEAALSRALIDEADRIVVSPDALARIRARCARRGVWTRIRSFLTHPRKDTP